MNDRLDVTHFVTFTDLDGAERTIPIRGANSHYDAALIATQYRPVNQARVWEAGAGPVLFKSSLTWHDED